jgi:PIN domain nuclease of toxin-antitoxin system
MRLLLGTHIYLWAVTDSRKLSKHARKLITDADEVFVSSASIGEASIKVGLENAFLVNDHLSLPPTC